jgi:hypothetical protein
MPKARPLGWGIGLLVLLVTGGTTRAHTRGGGDKATAPEPAAVTLRLQAVQSTYHLRDPADLRRWIEAAKRSEADEEAAALAGRQPDPKSHVAYPEPPAIDLTLTVENSSKKFGRLWNRGDDRGPLNIVLRGAGAVSVSPHRMHTMELRMPQPLLLAPGAKHVIHLDRLISGSRGDVQSYWTAAGQYQISIEWHTALAPGATTRPDDVAFEETKEWRTITLTSNPVTVTVRSP